MSRAIGLRDIGAVVVASYRHLAGTGAYMLLECINDMTSEAMNTGQSCRFVIWLSRHYDDDIPASRWRVCWYAPKYANRVTASRRRTGFIGRRRLRHYALRNGCTTTVRHGGLSGMALPQYLFNRRLMVWRDVVAALAVGWLWR